MEKHEKIQQTYRLTPAAARWLAERAREQGFSVNTLVQMMVNRAMDEWKEMQADGPAPAALSDDIVIFN